MKIVVTSHTAYRIPLEKFFQSVDANSHSDSIYKQIILIINGSEKDSIESDHRGTMIIHTQLDVWEYTAFVVLDTYKTHPDIQSDYYFLLHDTCLLGRGFYPKLLANEQLAKQLNCEIMTNHLPCSNIIVIHKDVIYGFSKDVLKIQTKANGCLIEQGLSLQDGTPSFYQKRKIHILGHRKEHHPIDVYKTGFRRTPFYYPVFDVMKYILWNKHGDFTNSVQNIFN